MPELPDFPRDFSGRGGPKTCSQSEATDAAPSNL